MQSGARKNEKLIFLCVDGSDNAQIAFNWFYENFYREEHTIGIVHIYSMPQSQHGNKLADVEEKYSSRVDDKMEESSIIIQKYLNECKKFGVKAKIFSQAKTDSIGRTICEMVKEHHPMSIVMGQRGLNAVERVLYGSVSDHLLHHAHIPILVIPPLKVK